MSNAGKKNHAPHYIHGMSYSFQERVVGTFILLAMVALLGLLIATGKTKYLFEDHITLYGVLATAQGVARDSTVRISGIEGGYVSDIDVSPENEIVVTMHIFKRFQRLLRSDSRATLRPPSFFGTRAAIIEFSAGSPERPLLADGDKVRIGEAFSMEDLAEQLSSGLAQVRETVDSLAAVAGSLQGQELAGTLEDIRRVSGNLRRITDQVAAGQGVLGAALYDEDLEKDFSGSIRSLNRTMTTLQSRLEELSPILADTGAVSATVKESLGNFPDLLRDIRTTIVQVNTMLVTLDSEIQQLPELVARMRLLLEESNRTLRAAQRVWPLSSAVEKAEGGELLVAPQPAQD